MTVAFTWTLEMWLTEGGPGWVDVSADVRTVAPITLSRGIDGSGITDRVAKVGTLSFALDNSIGNSGATLGYYSPDHASVRAGFGLGTLTRLKITYSGTTYYKFYGKISDLTPIAGAYKERYVSVQCVDYMNELLVHNTDKIDVQINKTGDQLLATIVANLPTAPLAHSYAAGPDTFAYSLHDIQDERTSAMNAVQRVDQSGLSFTFVTGDVAGGEVLKWQNRNTRAALGSVATFTNTMRDLIVNRKADTIYNTIKATGYAPNVGTVDEVLWASYQEYSIPAGGTLVITARYTDPAGAGRRVTISPATGNGGGGIMYAVSGVPGNGLGAFYSENITFGGNAASYAMGNSGAVTGYVLMGVMHGHIIRLYDPFEVVSTDATSQSLYGDRTLSIAFPYLNAAATVAAFSASILALCKDPHSTVDSLEFIANSNDTLMSAAMVNDVGTRITQSETVTGFSADDFFVNSYDLTLEPNKLTCKLGNLVPA